MDGGEAAYGADSVLLNMGAMIRGYRRRIDLWRVQCSLSTRFKGSYASRFNATDRGHGSNEEDSMYSVLTIPQQ